MLFLLATLSWICSSLSANITFSMTPPKRYGEERGADKSFSLEVSNNKAGHLSKTEDLRQRKISAKLLEFTAARFLTVRDRNKRTWFRSSCELSDAVRATKAAENQSSCEVRPKVLALLHFPPFHRGKRYGHHMTRKSLMKMKPSSIFIQRCQCC